MDGEDLDLSGLMDLDLKEMLPEAAEDLGKKIEDLSEKIDMEISPEELQNMTQDMILGFQESLPEDSDIEIKDPAENFQEYLNTEQAQNILKDGIREIILSDVDVKIPTERLWEIAAQLVTDYQNYVKENNIEDSSVATILAYLQLPEVQQNLTAQAESVIRKALMSGYNLNRSVG